MTTTSRPGPTLELTRPDGTVREIATEIVPIGQLSPDPRNARAHNERNMAAIVASLRRFDQQKPLVTDETGTIVRAGSGQLAGLLRLGYKEAWIVRSNLRGNDLTAYGVADNATAEKAEWDRDNFGSIVAELLAQDFGLEDLGLDLVDVEAFDLELPDLDVGDLDFAHERPASLAASDAVGPYPTNDPPDAPRSQDGPSPAAETHAGAVARPEPTPPGSFDTFDETVRTDFCCPRCGYEWSGNPKP